jgi:hypothetical protein
MVILENVIRRDDRYCTLTNKAIATDRELITDTPRYDKDVFALLSVEGKETPVVSLKLEGSSRLVVEYGEVDETGVTTVSARKQEGKNGKYIVCGRLVIVKDGKLYNSDGTVVK